MMASKRTLLLVTALFITLIISVGATAIPFYTDGEDSFTNIDNISKEEAHKNELIRRLALAIKCYESVDDVIINTETNPLQVNITTQVNTCLTPEAKEHIEELANSTFPNSTVDYS